MHVPFPLWSVTIIIIVCVVACAGIEARSLLPSLSNVANLCYVLQVSAARVLLYFCS